MTHELELNITKHLWDGKKKTVTDLIVEFNGDGDIETVQAFNETLDMWINVDLEKIPASTFQTLLERVNEKLFQINYEQRGAR